ncbi:hypothetical protein ABT063_33730 [Streptomyces sp. NPDC002838]|uniref:hypothetical protein n=1 Tax=Streptomyces sp. NPDC002838 TaxID=3154436 RepID=UPI00331BF7F9
MHSSRAATHLSTAVTGLADAHRLTSRPGGAEPVESQLNTTLGHAAALRSLNRALRPPLVRTADWAPDAGSPHPTRRRP